MLPRTTEENNPLTHHFMVPEETYKGVQTTKVLCLVREAPNQVPLDRTREHYLLEPSLCSIMRGLSVLREPGHLHI